MSELRARYLDLLKRCLINAIYIDHEPKTKYDPVLVQFTTHDARQVRRALRVAGEDWPAFAHTMVGLHRLDNVQACIERVLLSNVPGDLIEAGVWRGGVCILMRAILATHDDETRRVFVADSFAGLPPPNPECPQDAKGILHQFGDTLAVSADEVRRNFQAYGLLDERVVFVEGWFRDTLPKLQAERFAVIRIDGDMYGSTMDALEALYPRLSVGGFLIVDDYYTPHLGCCGAVDDYRAAHGIAEPIEKVDLNGAFWRREN